MENKEVTLPAKEKVDYTCEMLLNDIQSRPEEDGVETAVGDKAEREYRSKLIVVQTLLKLTAFFVDDMYKEDEKLWNAIEVKVNGDEILSGFLFFVSQNPQFDYSWNYMRKRKMGYIEFIAKTVRFIQNVLTDINMLTAKPWAGKDIHVVFNELIDVALIKTPPYVNASIHWENFYRIAVVKKDYNISIKIKDNVLVAGIRNQAADAEKLIDRAFGLVNDMTIPQNKRKDEVV